MYRHTFTFASSKQAQMFAEATQSLAMIWEKRPGQNTHEVSFLSYKALDAYWKRHYMRMAEPLESIQSGICAVHVNAFVLNKDVAEYYDPTMDTYFNTPEYEPDF